MNDPQVTQFNHFLDDQVKKGSPSMPTAESVIFEHSDVFEPSTDKPLQVVMWPAIKQVKQFPVLQGFSDGSLSSLECWVFDETTSGAVIKLKNGCIRLYDRRDLLQFRKWDIHYLSNFQIKVVEDIYEEGAKVYTTMVAEILNKSM